MLGILTMTGCGSTPIVNVAQNASTMRIWVAPEYKTEELSKNPYISVVIHSALETESTKVAATK